MNASDPTFPAQGRALTRRAVAEAVSAALTAALEHSGKTQEDFAREVMGFGDGGALSKIINGVRTLAVAKARLLDKAGYRTPTGGSFEQLARDQAAAAHAARRGQPQRRTNYDVFLASPMASGGKTYSDLRRSALDLVTAIENYCGYTVYYAGRDIESSAEFDAVDIAFGENWRALSQSRTFALYMPHAVTKPSSVWVEAGIALGLGMRSTYFVPDSSSLPYILQRAVLPKEEGGSELTRVQYTNDDPGRAAALVRRHAQGALHEG